MPFCPKCRYEYQHGVTVCPDCGEKLVNSLPENIGNGNPPFGPEDYDTGKHNWIPLAGMTSHQYAEMLLESLRARDIPAVINSTAGHFGVTGQMGTASFRPIGGGYTIMVDENYIAEAYHQGEGMFGDEWDKMRLIDISE